MKRVFLTFDDGIQEGTREVIQSLKKFNIKATFFITGINTFLYTKRDDPSIFKLLTKERHLICNHSFSHANDSYQEYYSQGGCINTTGHKISISDDFANNTDFLRSFLPHYTFDRLSEIGRLPGRNSWFIQPMDSNKQRVFFDADSMQSALTLAKNGYEIFGWDDEWHMSFDFVKISRAQRKLLLESNRVTYLDYDINYPDIDMLKSEYIKYDRIQESWETVAGRVMTNNKSDIVLLLHERAFRQDHFSSSTEPLNYFIEYLLENKISFDTLNNY